MINNRAFRAQPAASRKLVMRSVPVRAGVWAVIDSGVASAGNFLTFILLARLLNPDAYGRFALIFGTLVVLNNVHGGLVVYPLLLKGAAASDRELRSTCTEALFTTAFLAPVQLAVVAGACWYANVAAGWPMAALVAWQCQDTLRRTYTAQLLHANAVPGDAVSYLGQVALILGISRMSVLTLDHVFAAMVTTSIAAAVIQAIQIRPVPVAVNTLWRAARDFLHGGRWAFITYIFGTATPQIFLWSIALHDGAKQAAVFQALASVVGAINPVMFSAGNLIIPTAARCIAEADIRKAIRTSARYAVHGAVLIGPYILLMLLAPGVVLSTIYGAASPYSQLHSGLRLFAVYGLIAYAAHVAGALLNGIGKSNAVCMAHAISAVLAILSVPISMIGGLRFAILCLTVTAILRLALHLRDLISAAQHPMRRDDAVHVNG